MTSQGKAKAAKVASNDQGPARREQLLAIAAELFATRGYAKTTVREIADASGILSGSLYHHFDSKEAMLNEILHQFLDGLHQRFKAIVDQGGSPREILDDLVRESFATIDAEPHAVALYQNEVGQLAKIPNFEFVAVTSRKIERIWVRALTAGRDAGVFRADLEVNIIYRFIRDTVWASVRWYNPRGKFRHDTVADQFLAMLDGGLLAD